MIAKSHSFEEYSIQKLTTLKHIPFLQHINISFSIKIFYIKDFHIKDLSSKKKITY